MVLTSHSCTPSSYRSSYLTEFLSLVGAVGARINVRSPPGLDSDSDSHDREHSTLPLHYPVILPSHHPHIRPYRGWTIFPNTLPESPSKSWRKLAWVPVVPLTPRNLRSVRFLFRFLRSIRRSDTHRQVRLPTVVSCAGLKWIHGY